MYRYFVVFTNMNSEPITFSDEFVKILKDKEITSVFTNSDEQFNKALQSGDTRYVLYNNTSNIFCREELIGSIKSFVRKFIPFSTKFVRPMVFIKAENSGKLAVDSLGKFLNRDLSSIRIELIDEVAVLQYKANYSAIFIDLWVISLLLYIMRNGDLLDKILENFTETSYHIDTLISFLQNEFLEHPELGDGSNHPVALSMFCYTLLNRRFFTVSEASGPTTAAFCGIPINKFISYIKDIYLAKFPDRKGLEENRNSTPAHFLEAFDSVVDLIRNRKEK
jgi:hypothetical protein